jgi:hypothetical protein
MSLLPHPASSASGGAYVDWVVMGGPADAVGLKQGDVIVQVGTTPVATAAELESALAVGSIRAGQTVELAFVREGSREAAAVEAADPASIFPRLRLPFVAKIVEERDWTQNGVPLHETEQAALYRDRAGREATERLSPRPGLGLARTVHVFDPSAGVNIYIDDEQRIAVVVDSRRRVGNEPKAKPVVPRWSSQPSQYLGMRVIQGLRCEGYRRSDVLENPAELGVALPDPVIFTSEVWTSDLTLTPVLQISQDPLQGGTEWRMVEVREDVDPDPTIFQVPAGYEVRERSLRDLSAVRGRAQAGSGGTGGNALRVGNR